jgi:probable HAF family extracellular repeat protein
MDKRSTTVVATRDRTERKWPSATLPFLLLLSTYAAASPPKYTVARLQITPGGTSTVATGMNNAGIVVGAVADSDGLLHAVEWKNAVPIRIHGDIAILDGTSTAVAINSQGIVIGNARDSESSVFEFGPNINAGQAFDHGISVGATSDANVIVGELGGHPAIWANEDLSQDPAFLPTISDNSFGADPTGINVAGVIVGIENDFLPDFSDTYPVAVRWKPDPATHAFGAAVKALGGLGGLTSAANAINSNGWIVGWATLGNKLQHAALWEPTTGAFDLGTLGGKQSAANAINAEGDIAGQAQTSTGAWHAVLWTHKHFKATDLNLDIDPIVATQITLTSASATNDRCVVLANGVDNKSGVQESFVLSLTDQSQCNLL